MRMWWAEIERMAERVASDRRYGAGFANTSWIEPGAILDETTGPISIGAGSIVCAGATIRGPVIVGEGCLIGNQAMLRGPVLIEDGVRIGFATEIKNSELKMNALVGPMCFIADSRVDEEAYLGAQVRTSNQRLDRAPISVRGERGEVNTGRDKLGCWIGARASLGIQVIVLPGRVVAPDSLFEPRITISRNYPTGRYRAAQSVEAY
jgi:bifunctional UDP-N-acetylglucosamine pyrophosphorylase/glucosamine-1-phosphate N-acetyltransferase